MQETGKSGVPFSLKGMIALWPKNVPLDPGLRRQIETHGGVVVLKWMDLVNCGLTPTVGSKEAVAAGATKAIDCAELILAHKKLRAKKIPTLYSSWVTESVAAGRVLSRGSGTKYLCYDPHFLKGYTVTTTNMTRLTRKMVEDVVWWYGGVSCRDFSKQTDILIHEGTTSKKLTAAQALNKPCETIGWLQRCVDEGRLRPFTNKYLAAIANTLEAEVRMLGDDAPTTPTNQKTDGRFGEPLLPPGSLTLRVVDKSSTEGSRSSSVKSEIWGDDDGERLSTAQKRQEARLEEESTSSSSEEDEVASPTTLAKIGAKVGRVKKEVIALLQMGASAVLGSRKKPVAKISGVKRPNRQQETESSSSSSESSSEDDSDDDSPTLKRQRREPPQKSRNPAPKRAKKPVPKPKKGRKK